MGTARRLYLYSVSLVSLLALTGGLGSLLQLLLQRAQDAGAGTPLMGGDMSTGQAALSLAMIAVGGPVWGFHWWLVRRAMRSPAPEGDDDRSSAARAWYLALVMGIALSAAVSSLIGLISLLLCRVVGVTGDEGWSLPLAVAIVAVPTWVSHARMQRLEIRNTAMRRIGSIGRLYRYLALYALSLVLLTGATGVIETVLSVLVGRTTFESEAAWRYVAAGQVAAIVVGGGASIVHWWDARTSIRDAAMIGVDERVTLQRWAFFAAGILTAMVWLAVGVANAVASAGRLLAGMAVGSDTAWLEDVVGPPLALLPVAVAAWWLTGTIRREAIGVGTRQVLAARRLTALLPSLVGLGFLAAGIIGLLQTGLLRLGGVEPNLLYRENENDQLPWYIAQVLVGLALWLPAWTAVLQARRRDPVQERTASASRAHLFLVVGVAIVAGVPATIAILFRLLLPLLGGTASSRLLADLAFPLAVLGVAVVGGAYHARILLGDLALGPAGGARVPAVQPLLKPAAAGVTASPSRSDGMSSQVPIERHLITVDLVLEVPDNEDAPAVVAGLQSMLPPGARLRLRPIA